MRTTGEWIGLSVAIGIFATLAGFVSLHGPGSFVIRDVLGVGASLGFLIIGMACQYLVWHFSLRLIGFRLDCRTTLRAHGLTIWAKYIPGKIWSVAGRAALVSRYTGSSLTKSAFASATAQAAMIGAGLAIALPVVARTPNLLGLSLKPDSLVAAAVTSTLICVVAAIAVLVHSRRRIVLSRLHPLIPMVSFSLATWVFWGAGFLALLRSAGHTPDALAALSSFAAATTAGILTMITPGGMGIREGLLSALLRAEGLAWPAAAAAALAARVWFVLGEAAVFLVATWCTKNPPNSSTKRATKPTHASCEPPPSRR